MAYTTINKSSLHFNTKLWTGTGSENAITGVGFQPDWVWIKERNNTTSHRSFDVLRGATYEVFPDLNDGHSADAQSLKSFDSDGFTLGTDGATNGSSDTYVAWNWKAGGSGSANSNGSVASTVSANTTAGFSIVKFSYPGSGNFTVGHGLGVAPKMFILKGLGTANWQVYHESLGNTNNTQMNYTNAKTSAANWWGSTSPTSTVFTVGADLIESGQDGIAYCFAEKKGFSKFGSYKGNASGEGTFIYTGFKPAFLLIKNADASSTDWYMYDNKRGGPLATIYGNVNKYFVKANSSAAESNESLDMLSNGFKMRITNNFLNGSGNQMIYMAFAEAPLVSTENIPCTAR